MHTGGRDYGGQAGSLGQVGNICKRRRRGAWSPRLCAPLGLSAGGQPSQLLQRDGTGRWDGRGGRGGVFPAAPGPVCFCFFTEPTFLLVQEVVKEGVNTCSAWEGAARATGRLLLRISTLQFVAFFSYPPKC